MKRIFYPYLAFLLLLSICACKSAEVRPAETNSTLAQSNNRPAPPLEIADFEEPPIFDGNPALKRAWQQFVADGRYRLARVSDMKFSAPARRRMNESFSWWQLGYPIGRTFAAIVIDYSRSDDERFGIVVFRPSYNGDAEVSYTQHWLFRGRDLSRTALDSPSGYLFVHEFEEGGSYKSCEVKWNGRRNKYVCLPMNG